MSRVRRAVAAALLAGALGGVQAAVPPAGLAAEGEGRWTEALDIYQRQLAATPDAELWLRVSAIQTRLKQPLEAAQSLRRAAELRPRDAELQARASQAFAVAGAPREALAFARRAQELEPQSRSHLQAVAELASWSGDTALAERSYRELLRREPANADALHALARLHTQAGRLDEASGDYAAQRRLAPADPSGWLEGATVEEYRGDYAAAARLLAEARARFGASEALAQADAELLTRSGRATAALEALPDLLADDPGRYELHLLRTLALQTSGQRDSALQSLGELERLGPQRPETHGARLQVETPQRPSVAGGLSWSDDTTGIGSTQGALSAALSPWSSARVTAALTSWQLAAPAGSAFITPLGDDRLAGETVSLTIDQRVAPWLGLRAGGGTFRPEVGDNHPLYEAAADLHPGDRIDLELGRTHDVLMASPRSAALGIERSLDRARLRWRQGYTGTAELTATASHQSDGNDALEYELVQRVAVRRTERYNLDLGARAQHLGYDHHAGNGYYDPDDFRRYQALGSAWVKLGYESGLGLMLSVGPERDAELDDAYAWGGDARLEGLFGAYGTWQVRGHAAYGGRFDGTDRAAAWRGTGVGLELMRRF